MKLVVCIFLIISSFTIKAKTFDCYLRVGMITAGQLLQTSFAENDPEEESEEYELTLASGFSAYVLYLPYQDGLDLFVSKGDFEANANFDQESDDYANLDVSLEGTDYSLFCQKR